MGWAIGSQLKRDADMVAERQGLQIREIATLRRENEVSLVSALRYFTSVNHGPCLRRG